MVIKWLCILMFFVETTSASYFGWTSTKDKSIACDKKIMRRIINTIGETGAFEGKEAETDTNCDKFANARLKYMDPQDAKEVLENVLMFGKMSIRSDIAKHVKQYIYWLVDGVYLVDTLMKDDPKNDQGNSILEDSIIESDPCSPKPDNSEAFNTPDSSRNILTLVYWLAQIEACPDTSAVDAMVEISHIITGISHESIRGAALVSILNTYIDLVQRGMHQVAKLDEESKIVNELESTLLTTMNAYYINIKT